MDDIFIMDLFMEDDMNLNVLQAIVENPGGNNIVPDNDIPVYNEGYFEYIVPRYSIFEFKSHFRMNRETFQVLCGLIAQHLPENRLNIALEKKVMFFIWLLSKQESFLAVSDRFGFSKGTGHYIFLQILSALTALKNEFIQWPNPRRCQEIADRIENRYRLPGVVGAIDGCHISIKQPINNAIDFYNRKEHHSIILQAVCDDKKVFTDVFIGMPGRVHDARVFRNSPLYNRLIGNPPLLTPTQHLLGDAAYPLLLNLLKPFRDNGHLNQIQLRFNQILSAQRSVIERAFALLKGKWRRLKYIDMSLNEEIPNVILAACILHNFILSREMDDDEVINDDEFNNAIGEDDGDNDFEVNNNGSIKRNYIATLL